MASKFVYADNAATTAVSKTAFETMTPYLTQCFGNPSGMYSIGREAKKAIENARQQVASAIGANPSEIYFTSCGTESDNWAIKSIAQAKKDKGKNIITSAVEHHAVLHTMDYLKKQG